MLDVPAFSMLLCHRHASCYVLSNHLGMPYLSTAVCQVLMLLLLSLCCLSIQNHGLLALHPTFFLTSCTTLPFASASGVQPAGTLYAHSSSSSCSRGRPCNADYLEDYMLDRDRTGIGLLSHFRHAPDQEDTHIACFQCSALLLRLPLPPACH